MLISKKKGDTHLKYVSHALFPCKFFDLGWVLPGGCLFLVVCLGCFALF